MRDKRITIVDIAKHLGLSTSTVSRALGRGDINPETKRIVLEYVSKINYKRNDNAYFLRKKMSQTIGVIVTEIGNSFFSQIINGIEKISYRNNYNIIIAQSHDSAERELELIKHLSGNAIDGLLISLSNNSISSPILKSLQDRGLSIVYFDRVAEGVNSHHVKVDNYRGAFKATDFLIKKGLKKLLYVTHSPRLQNSKERLRGFEDALSSHGLTCGAENVIEYQSEVEIIEYFKDFQSILQLGILIAHESLTVDLLIALKRLGLLITGASIVAFTNSQVVDLFYPPISSIYQPASEIGEVATEMLIELILSKEPQDKVKIRVLDTELFIRE